MSFHHHVHLTVRQRYCSHILRFLPGSVYFQADNKRFSPSQTFSHLRKPLLNQAAGQKGERRGPKSKMTDKSFAYSFRPQFSSSFFIFSITFFSSMSWARWIMFIKDLAWEMPCPMMTGLATPSTGVPP